MLKQLLCASAVTCLTLPSWALAAVPTFSGKYSYAIQILCEASKSYGGQYEHDIGTGTFDSGTQRLTVKGLKDTGDITVGAGFSESTVKSTTAYSNDATTITFFGVTYNVVYSVVKTGVVQQANWMGLNTNSAGASCTERGNFVKE